jgi:hypothetical protein
VFSFERSMVLLIVCLAVLAWPAAVSAAVDRCREEGGRTVVETSRLRVYAKGPEKWGERVYVCRRTTGRVRFLAGGDDSFTVEGVVVRGWFVKYESRSDGKYGDVTLDVIVVNEGSGRTVHEWGFAQYRSDAREPLPPRALEVHGERLRVDGVYAFLVGGVEPAVGDPRRNEVHVGYHGRERALARSETIDPASFEADDVRVGWKQDGYRTSAELPRLPSRNRCPHVSQPDARSPAAVMWVASGTVFGCRFDAGRTFAMERIYDNKAVPARIAGRYGVFPDAAYDHYESRYLLLNVQLWDMKHRKRVRLPSFETRFSSNGDVSDLELRATGSFALILTNPWDTTAEVWLVPRVGRVLLLDRGPDIDPTSLARTGSRVSWTSRGQTREATLP